MHQHSAGQVPLDTQALDYDVHQDIESVLFTEEEIKAKVAELGRWEAAKCTCEHSAPTAPPRTH